MNTNRILLGDMCSIRGDNKHNEDYAVLSLPYGACLADGMGGEKMGETIARCACQVASKALTNGASASESLARAQSYSKELVENLDSGRSGAAVTVLRCDGSDVDIAWAGDVLCLHLSGRSGEVQTLTKPDRGKRGLTNAIGGKSCNVNKTSCRIEAGDRLLLCSDGVWENNDTQAIKYALTEAQTPREAAVLLAMGQKHADDATAVVLFVNEEAPGSPVTA